MNGSFRDKTLKLI